MSKINRNKKFVENYLGLLQLLLSSCLGLLLLAASSSSCNPGPLLKVSQTGKLPEVPSMEPLEEALLANRVASS
jgi:hypothetical protein